MEKERREGRVDRRWKMKKERKGRVKEERWRREGKERRWS